MQFFKILRRSWFFLLFLMNFSALSGEHAYVLTPDEEQELFLVGNFKRAGLITWNECRDDVRANFVEQKCSQERFISPELYHLLLTDFRSCVDSSLQRIGKKKSKRIQIVHKGIMADARHSPLSLHSYGRAIDIHSLEITSGLFKKDTFTFETEGDGPFFLALRSCWGRVIQRKGECALIENEWGLTGSIGKEDEDHQYHLHLSIPQCSGGTYDMNLFMR